MGISKIKKMFAFTLAEVLITLGIIGVVAALTVPTLVNNYQKQEYVSKLKKTYATLNQAFQQYATDQGCPGDLACTGLFSAATSLKTADWKYFFDNYLKVATDCGTGSGCFPTETNLNIAGTVTPDSDPAFYKVRLVDGQSLGVQTINNCIYYNGASSTNSLRNTCASFVLDINGVKGPNKAGRDYFPWVSFAINSTHFVVPMYGSKDFDAICSGTGACVWSNASANANYYCGTAVNSSGQGCASRIVEEGWVMNY